MKERTSAGNRNDFDKISSSWKERERQVNWDILSKGCCGLHPRCFIPASWDELMGERDDRIPNGWDIQVVIA